MASEWKSATSCPRCSTKSTSPSKCASNARSTSISSSIPAKCFRSCGAVPSWARCMSAAAACRSRTCQGSDCVIRIQPEKTSEIIEAVRSHADARRPLAIEGSGSKSGLGRPVEADELLSLRGLSGIRLYQPDELVLTAWSGTPMREIQEALVEKHQHLAFEPSLATGFDDGSNEAGTIGGVLACNLSEIGR